MPRTKRTLHTTTNALHMPKRLLCMYSSEVLCLCMQGQGHARKGYTRALMKDVVRTPAGASSCANAHKGHARTPIRGTHACPEVMRAP